MRRSAAEDRTGSPAVVTCTDMGAWSPIGRFTPPAPRRAEVTELQGEAVGAWDSLERKNETRVPLQPF